MKKRILCGLLAAIMIMLVLPVQAFAAEKINGVYVDTEFDKVIGTVTGAKSFSYSGKIPDGMKLTGSWAFSHKADAYVLDVKLSGKPTTAGDYSFDVNYKSEDGALVKKISYSISIAKDAPFDFLHSIEVAKWPTKLDYYLGDTIDTTGMKVIAYAYKYDADEEAFVPFELDVTNMAWIDPASILSDNTEGMNINVYVSAPCDQQGNLKTFDDHFRVNIKYADPSDVLRVEVYKKPTKLTYTVGESLDTTGMTLRVHKGDGSAEDITEGFSVDTKKLEEAGSKTVTATYKDSDGKEFTASFDVTVTEAISSSSSSSAPESSSSSSSEPEVPDEPSSSEPDVPDEPSSEEEPVDEPVIDEPVDEPVVEEPVVSEPEEVPVIGDEVEEPEEKGGIPFWVWIIVALLVILVGAAVVLFLIGRKRLEEEDDDEE
ncbi:MAG: bacterial Ig-like domain-containing protein [Oscillospiraceae bacterium]|nr:bacterial Ig-like domain-containing protein [Oscillospiraceae bacterium]